jgi:hypothetical protein
MKVNMKHGSILYRCALRSVKQYWFSMKIAGQKSIIFGRSWIKTGDLKKSFLNSSREVVYIP